MVKIAAKIFGPAVRVAKGVLVHFELLIFTALLGALALGLAVFWNFAWRPTTAPSEPQIAAVITVPDELLNKTLSAMAERARHYETQLPFEPPPDIFR